MNIIVVDFIVPGFMTPEEQQKRTELEQQINEEFLKLGDYLTKLKSEIESETDNTKKEEKQKEFRQLEMEASQMKHLIDTLSQLQAEDLQSLKTKLEDIKKMTKDFGGDLNNLANEVMQTNGKIETPETYRLLEGSETRARLLNIISSNPQNFINVEGNSPEEKLEKIFEKIRGNVVQFLENKLGNSPECNKMINSTIAPAFERNMMEMLKNQGNDTNKKMLNGMDKISWNGNNALEKINNLITSVGDFATNTRTSFDKFNQWVNAVDYLAVSMQNGTVSNIEKSAVLTNPIEFKNYMNNPVFSPKNAEGNTVSFSPYNQISENIFKIDANQSFQFGITPAEQQSILNEIGNIDVVNSPRTTELIVKMMDKSKNFLDRKDDLQNAANSVLNGLNSVNGITNIIGIDLVGEITKPPEKRSFVYKIFDFICKLIGFTGGIEGIVKNRRLDRLKLDNQKKNNIKLIYEKFKEKNIPNRDVTISDKASCEQVLQEFELTDWNNNSPSTRGDHLGFSIVDNLDLSLVAPSVVKSLVGDNYVTKTEEILPNGKKQIKETVDVAELEKIKKDFVYKHITTMKNHFRENYNDLTDFFKNIRSVDDISISMTTALYANKEDVIEGIKAKIFLPESYGVVYSGNQGEGTDNSGNGNAGVEVATAGAAGAALLDLTSSEKSEMQNLVEQSKTPNNINYLENPTYKKYLNVIERDLKLPKHALECVCKQESQGKLYNGKNIIGSRAGAQGLFQFMPGTADSYMKNSQLGEKYGKTFKSRDEFLKDPLATAWAAGIMYSGFLSKGYSFQSSLACYNRGEGHYKGKFKDKKALTAGDLEKLPNETKKYVENITKDVLAHNSASSSDILADLSKYSWNESATPNGDIESQRNKELFIGPSLLAQNEKQLGGLGNSIMNGIQGLDKKTNFPNMNGIVGKNTKNHPDMLRSKEDVAAYKKANPDVKSFMLYFGENNSNYDETLKDITKLAELLHAEGIQPVLCTCIGEDKHSRIPSLNSGILALGQQKQYPIFNFDKAYKDGDIKIGSDGVHPTSYAPMTDIIKSQINQA